MDLPKGTQNPFEIENLKETHCNKFLNIKMLNVS